MKGKILLYYIEPIKSIDAGEADLVRWGGPRVAVVYWSTLVEVAQ